MNTRKFLFVVLSFVLLMALAGCGSSSGGSSKGESNGKKTLVIWAHKDTGFEKADKQLVKDFEAAHPNIKIKYESFPYEQYIKKLKASFSASNGPDIARMFGTWVPQYSKNGLLMEVPNGDKIKDNYYKAPIGAYLLKGKLYGIPMEYNIENGGMLVHPKMFKDKGLDYPKTWSQLVSDARKLAVSKGKNIKIRGFDFTSYDSVTFQFLAMILQQKGKYWDGNGHVNFHSPEAIKAMSELVKLARDYKVSDYNEMNADLDSSDYFFKGKSAMTLRGPWVIPSGKINYKVDNFDYVSVPSFTDNPPYFAAESGWGFVANKKTDYPKAATEFLKFVSQPKNEMKWNIANYTVPAQKSVAQDPDFVKAVPMMKTSLDVLQYGQWIGPIGDRDYMWDQTNNEFISMCSGKESVKDGLKKLETNINAMIDRMN